MKISSKEIVSEIKKSVKQRNPIYEKYLQDNAIFYLDPVENNEFLGSGWGENSIINNEVVKEVGKKFSYIIDISYATEMMIEATLQVDNPFLNSAKLTISVDDKEIGTEEIRHSHFHSYTFKLPKSASNRKVTVKGSVDFSKPGSKLFIRLIAGHNMEMSVDQIERSLTMEINQSRLNFEHMVKVLEWHKHPELLMPANAKLKFLKKIVLKIIRPFTTAQIAYNNYAIDTLNSLNDRLNKLEDISLLLLQMKKK